MHCQQATELMSLELDSMLDQAERHELDFHLAECADCRQTWAAMQQISSMFENAPMASPAPGFTQRVNQRIIKRQARKQLMAGYTVLAAGLLLLLALPLTYLAQPMSNIRQVIVQQPGLVGNSLQLLMRFGGILGTFLQACWLLISAVSQSIPQPVLLVSFLFAGSLIVAWLRLISGQVVTQRNPTRS